MNIETIPTYQEALALLDGFANNERVAPAKAAYGPGTERVTELLKRLDSPQAVIPAVHIAGTKGKGSTAHYAAAALAANGIRTGLYTSPHVEDLRERIMINGRPVGELPFIEACMTVLREADAMRAEGNPPSYFEVLTAVAFVAFRSAMVDAMVLETGLGGRLDATNIPDLRVVASGITPISKDHEEILGHTLAEIAAEKAGIIRNGVPVVLAPQEAGVMKVLTDKATECQSPVFLVGRDVESQLRKQPVVDKPRLGQRFDMETWRSVYPDVVLPMLGEHQAVNASVALGLVELFLEYIDRDPIDVLVLKRAWRNLRLPARMEVVDSEPWHIIDGAHNPASAWAASETLDAAFSTRDRTLVFGVAADKDYETMLRILAPLFGRMVFVGYHSARAVDPATLAAFAAKEFPGKSTAVALDAAHALELAKGFTGAGGLILTTGSLYLAGEMRALCRQETAAKG